MRERYVDQKQYGLFSAMRFSIRWTHPETFAKLRSISVVNLTDNGGTYIPNFPAPERAYPVRTNEDDSWMPGTPGTGIQPKGPNNPKGDVPGIPVMTITG